MRQPRLEQLVVVDDHSTDGTAEWLQSLTDPRVKTVSLGEHSERAAARNAGLDKVRSEYVLFLDDDDRLSAGSLAHLASALDGVASAVAAVGAVLMFSEAGQRQRMHHPLTRRVVDAFGDVMIGWTRSPGCTLFRTDVLRRVGGWPPQFVPIEDQHLWLMVSRLGPTILIPQVALLHRRHEGQTRPGSDDRFERERALRRAFVETLEEPERTRAASLLESRKLFIESTLAWYRGDLRGSFEAIKRSVAISRALARSPLVGRRMRSLLLRSAAGSLIGPEAAARAQRVFWGVRRKIGRAPQSPAGMLGTQDPGNRPSP